MIRSKRTSDRTIDLTGPQGNAYNLLGVASNLGKQLDLDVKEIQRKMMDGDYENLVQEFDKAFGSIITLER